MAAALALVILNLRQYYIGGELAGVSGEDLQKLAALQFGAKIHELLMLASLGEVLFTWLRKELAFGDGIPLGAVFAGLQFTSLSTLWAPEFWGTVFDAYAQGKGRRARKWYLICLIVVCTLLGVSVGPSTANLMRPRLDYWPAGGTKFWLNVTSDEIHPKTVAGSTVDASCAEDRGDATCPYGDYETVAQEYFSFFPKLKAQGDMPDYVYVAGPYSLRQLLFSIRSQSGSQQSIWPYPFTTSSVPSAGVSDALAELGKMWAFAAANSRKARRFVFRRDVRYSVKASQPAAMVRCTNISDAELVSSRYLEFVDLNSLVDGTGLGQQFASYSEAVIWQDAAIITALNKTLTNLTQPEVIWVDNKNLLNSTGSTLAAIVPLPNDQGDDASYYCCSIDSRWIPSTFLATRDWRKTVSGDNDDTRAMLNLYGTYRGNWNRTYPASDWATYLYPSSLTNDGAQTNVFAKMASVAGIFNSSTPAESGNTIFIIEALLASSIANGLGRINYNATRVGVLRHASSDPWSILKGSWINYFWSTSTIGYGGDIYKVTAKEKRNATEFVMRADAYGYAYSAYGASQIAQVMVLVVYIVLATAHFAYTVSTGWSFTAWDSAPELAVLALNSRQTGLTYNTGAGIGTVATFEKSVRIRDRDGHLEMVFEDTVAGTTKPYTRVPYG